MVGFCGVFAWMVGCSSDLRDGSSSYAVPPFGRGKSDPSKFGTILSIYARHSPDLFTQVKATKVRYIQEWIVEEGIDALNWRISIRSLHGGDSLASGTYPGLEHQESPKSMDDPTIPCT